MVELDLSFLDLGSRLMLEILTTYSPPTILGSSSLCLIEFSDLMIDMDLNYTCLAADLALCMDAVLIWLWLPRLLTLDTTF